MRHFICGRTYKVIHALPVRTADVHGRRAPVLCRRVCTLARRELHRQKSNAEEALPLPERVSRFAHVSRFARFFLLNPAYGSLYNSTSISLDEQEGVAYVEWRAVSAQALTKLTLAWVPFWEPRRGDLGRRSARLRRAQCLGMTNLPVLRCLLRSTPFSKRSAHRPDGACEFMHI